MVSQIPDTISAMISSTKEKASSSGRCGAHWRRRLLSMTIEVSAWLRRSSSPSSAANTLAFSRWKGVVTRATTIAPLSRARRATTGADPVPVPPPRPARTNTRSASFKMPSSSGAASSAALRPSSGSPPAPMPRVSLWPMRIFASAQAHWSCWLSVFMARVLAPGRP